MSKVFVLDPNQQPVDPVHPGWARKLLSSGRAAVFRRFPFTIILRAEVIHRQVQPCRLKLDPGSLTTGIAIVNEASGEVVFAAEITHRGQAIKAALDHRRAIRRSRRARKTRYRKPRFANRRRRPGWLPPSLESRLANIETWVRKLCKLCPITAISMELVKFDLQQMENPEISDLEYQQGELQGYEVREYLLEKWGRQCSYCGAKDVPLQIEHIHCRAKGGTNRLSNLTLACEPCNRRKGTQDLGDFLKGLPDVEKRLLAQAKAPLKDATAVNATRWELYERLKRLELPVECGSGGRTKFNRVTRGLPKTHCCDAACVGESTPAILQVQGIVPLLIQAQGHGRRQMCGTDKSGFPIRHRKRQRRSFGFQTGDMVRAVVPRGKKTGVHVGRVLVRAAGSFDICTKQGRISGINHRYSRALHRCDGYSYQKAATA